MFRPVARGIALAVAVGSMPAHPTAAQPTYFYEDINPNQSTLDATNPNGASGGRVNGLGRAPNGTTFFAATEWGGIYRSLDTGRNWAYLVGHLPMATWDVEVDPSNGSRIFATSFYDGRVSSVAGINVSTDGGATWIHPATAGPPAAFCDTEDRRDNPSAFGIAIDPANSNHVVIGTNCGVARSTNAGVTWAFIDPTPANGADDVWDVVIHDGGTIDVCGDDGHRRSTDGGVNWTTATANALPGGRCSITASPDEPAVLIAVVGTQIFESDDGGGTWPITLTNPSIQGRIPFVTANQRAGTTFDLWFGDTRLHRASCTTPATGTGRRCPDNTWTNTFNGAHADGGDVVFAAATDGCPIMHSNDGGVYFNTLTTAPACQTPTWEQPTVTPHALWLYAMAGATRPGLIDEDLYLGAQDNGAFGTTTAPVPGFGWTNSDCCDAHNFTATTARALYTVCCFNVAPANRLFLRNPGLTGGGQFGGTTPAGALGSFREQDALIHFSANGVAAITTTGVFVTTDITASSVTWTRLGAATTPGNAQVIKAGVEGGTPSFFVLSGDGNGVTQDELFRFDGTAAAGTWDEIEPPGASGGFGIFAVDPSDPDHLIASHLRTGQPPAMIRSTDGGANWVTLAALDLLMTGNGVFRYVNNRGPVVFGGAAAARFTGYPQPTLLAFDPGDPRTIVAGGADAGVFLSVDRGTTWSLITDPVNSATSGVPHIPRPHFAYFDREGSTLFERVVNIYVGTQGRGAWRIRRGELTGLIDVCGIGFRRCLVPELELGKIILPCKGLAFDRCRFIDPIPRNCLVKYQCPGCEGINLCPPFYNLVLDDFDPERWAVGLYSRDGKPVDHRLIRTKTGVVLSFRPSRRSFQPGRIGDYLLAFALNEGIEPETVAIKASLTVTDHAFGDRGEEGSWLRRASGPPPVSR